MNEENKDGSLRRHHVIPLTQPIQPTREPIPSLPTSPSSPTPSVEPQKQPSKPLKTPEYEPAK